jgi:hypothetical protein
LNKRRRELQKRTEDLKNQQGRSLQRPSLLYRIKIAIDSAFDPGVGIVLLL